MTWQEMIEAAHLDALGLLDEQERERFDAAFMKLPADLKTQLRAEQDRAVRFEIAETDGLEDSQPPASLRDLVLAAIRTASAQSQTVEHKGGRQVRPMRKASAVSPFWRAGALGLVAACLVMGGVFVKLVTQVQGLEEQSRGIAMSDAWRAQFARKTSDIAFDRNTVHKIFTATKDGFSGKAAIFHHKDWDNKAQFQCQGLPVAGKQTYKVVVLDGQGKPEKTLAKVATDGGRDFLEISVDVSQLARLALVMVEADGTEAVVMTIKV